MSGSVAGEYDGEDAAAGVVAERMGLAVNYQAGRSPARQIRLRANGFPRRSRRQRSEQSADIATSGPAPQHAQHNICPAFPRRG